MGWGGGTDIFDGVLDAVLPLIHWDSHPEVIEKVADLLWDGDWDTEEESKYYDQLEPIMKRRFPHMFGEEE